MRVGVMGSFLTSAEEEDGPAAEEEDACAPALKDDPEATDVAMIEVLSG